MKVNRFKVRLEHGNNAITLNVPATADRLFQLVVDCLTSETYVEILDIHDCEKDINDD